MRLRGVTKLVPEVGSLLTNARDQKNSLLRLVDFANDLHLVSFCSNSFIVGIGRGGTSFDSTSARELGLLGESNVLGVQDFEYRNGNANEDHGRQETGRGSVDREMNSENHDEWEHQTVDRVRKQEGGDECLGMRTGESPCLKPDIYDGTGSVEDYFVHYEMVAEINDWSGLEMMQFLKISLRGEALQVVQQLEQVAKTDYRAMKEKLLQRFSSINRSKVFQAQLSARRRGDGESLPKLAQNIRYLVGHAYPELHGYGDMFEKLSTNHFLDALISSEMRAHVFYSHPRTLDDALSHALEVEVFQEMEAMRIGNTITQSRQAAREVSFDDTTASTLWSTVDKLKGDLQELKTAHSRPNSKRTKCFRCFHFGHFARECPNRGKNQKKNSTN